jgi:photosystem II stability/assembly factor-like uncharacterized protein
MREDEAGAKARSAFEDLYQPPEAGFDSRMRDALRYAPTATRSQRWVLEAAAVVLALVAILTVALPRFLPITTSRPILKPSPTPITVPKQTVLAPFPADVRITNDGSAWFFIGRSVYRSTDGGLNWTNVNPTALTASPVTVFALDSNRAWLATRETGQELDGLTFYGTIDRGASWLKLGSAPVTGRWTRQMIFVDPRHGWILQSLAAAAGSEAVSVWGTTDGGHTWIELASSSKPQEAPAVGQLSSGCAKEGMAFSDEMNGWMTGSCAAGSFLYRTSDGGRSWSPQSLPTVQGQADRYFPSIKPPIFINQSLALLPVVAAVDANAVTVVYISHDGGNSWQATDRVAGGRLVAAARPDHWIITAPPRQIAVTVDGRSYSFIASDADLSLAVQLTFADELRGLALVLGPEGGYEMIRTDDGGTHWSRAQVPG